MLRAGVQLAQQLEGWADKYKESYELKILGKRVIVVFNPDDVKNIFLMRPSKFRRGLTPVSSSKSTSNIEPLSSLGPVGREHVVCSLYFWLRHFLPAPRSLGRPSRSHL